MMIRYIKFSLYRLIVTCQYGTGKIGPPMYTLRYPEWRRCNIGKYIQKSICMGRTPRRYTACVINIK